MLGVFIFGGAAFNEPQRITAALERIMSERGTFVIYVNQSTIIGQHIKRWARRQSITVRNFMRHWKAEGAVSLRRCLSEHAGETLALLVPGGSVYAQLKHVEGLVHV